MFLDTLKKNNPSLIDYALKECKNGNILPDSYVVDLDVLLENAKYIKQEADKYGITLYFMLKQIGRNPLIGQELMKLGYAGAVCVDYKEALCMIDNGVHIGNVGHLVQVPRCALKKIVASKADVITVYSLDKIKEINEVAKELNIKQGLMIRLTDDDSDLYSGQIAGFSSSELPNLVSEINKLDNVELKGLTVFPALLYNEESACIEATSNMLAMNRGLKFCKEHGLNDLLINLPSCSCTASMKLVHDLHGNNAEPGHGLSGTTPLHKYSEQVEKVAYCYVSEISHNFKGKSYCYGGGEYRRGHLENILVGDSLAESVEDKVCIPDLDSIDYHFELANNHKVGTPCVMSFRTQIFTTRSNVLIVKGLHGEKVETYLYDSQGRKVDNNWKYDK